MSDDIKFMKLALKCASAAVSHGNEPFGAVLVKDGKVVASSENRIYSANDFTRHAEIELIREYCKVTGDPILKDCTLYTSCEPCYMCSGAMIWAKLGRLVYGASDTDLGEILGIKGSTCCQSVFDSYPDSPEIVSGVLRDESIAILKSYFENHNKN